MPKKAQSLGSQAASDGVGFYSGPAGCCAELKTGRSQDCRSLVWYRDSVSNFPAVGSSAASTITCTVSAGFGALSARDRSSYCFFKPLKALSRGVSRGQVCGFKVCYRTYCTVPTLSVALSPGTVICCNLVTRHSAANAR
jgi:hypothetical protein